MHLLAFAEQIQLFPDGTLFVHVALILLMIYILNRTLYKPINRILDSRERNKGGNFTEAEQILATVSEKESRYTKELLDTRSAGYSLIEKEQKKATAAREKKLAEAHASVAEKLESGRADLEKQTAAARKTIAADAEELGAKIAVGILKS
jgi:F-type H+-transporting ATPase subunit b